MGLYRSVIGVIGLHLYGFGTECYALREDHRVGFFEKRVLRETFRRKREEVTRSA
jgi:hypothetical protein